MKFRGLPPVRMPKQVFDLKYLRLISIRNLPNSEYHNMIGLTNLIRKQHIIFFGDVYWILRRCLAITGIPVENS